MIPLPFLQIIYMLDLANLRKLWSKLVKVMGLCTSRGMPRKGRCLSKPISAWGWHMGGDRQHGG